MAEVAADGCDSDTAEVSAASAELQSGSFVVAELEHFQMVRVGLGTPLLAAASAEAADIQSVEIA